MSDVIPLLKFTPSAQDPQVLEAITVQREPLIKKLVEVALAAEDSAPHQLLVGPRGIGKTHILSLVASRLRAEESSDSFTLAWLEEDPWPIGSYGKLLAAILAQIAEERSDPPLAARADELRASRDESGREAEEALRDAVGGSRLVLLVENLDEIFRRIGANGQERLRAFIENWKRMLVIATAPQLFEGVQLHESPFYGFFAITHLEELNLDSATELMRRVAELRNDEKLVEFLGTDIARRRLAAVEALAGGHPRIWLLLSGCVSIQAIDELVPLFLEALDELTPYYQDRLRELGDQQQEIVVLLSEAGGALSNRALAERSGIAQNQVATILKQLAERGYVRRAEVSEEIAEGDARLSYWELREPLMRLCLDVKQARGKPLRMVVEFLRAWYGPRLLDELAALPPSAKLASLYVSEAFRTFDDALPPDELLRGSPSEILARAELGLSLAPERTDLQVARASSLVMERKFEQAREAYEALEEVDGPPQFKLSIAIQLAAVKDALGESIDGDVLAAQLLELGDEELDDAEAQRLTAMGLTSLGRNEEAAGAYQRTVELDPEDPIVFGGYGRTLGELGRHKEALDALTRAVQLDPENDVNQANLGIALRELGRHEEAAEAFERAIELAPDKAYLREYASTLTKLGRDEQALDSLTEAAELDPEDARIQSGCGNLLLRLRRFNDAIAAFSRAIKLDPGNAYCQDRLGVALGHLGRFDEAMVAHDRAVELSPDNSAIQNNRGAALIALGRYEDALEAFTRAIEIEPDDSELLSNQAVALIHLGCLDEALAAFRRGADRSVDNPIFHLNFSEALRRAGHYEEALAVLDRAIELSPDDGSFFGAKALALEDLDRLDEALSAYRQASDLEPTNAEFRNLLANLLRRLGRLDDAQAAAREAIARGAQNPIYRFTLVEISLTGGNIESAVSQLREALEIWSEQRHTPPGETGLLCRILWELPVTVERRNAIERIVAAYDEFDAAEELGRGLVSSISLLADPEAGLDAARSWVDDWRAADEVEDLQIPMRLLRAAGAWKEDRDRSHLLELPPEQRQILIDLLPTGPGDR
jgi:tetratricopeptide (TPR) repeat protein